jgi:rhamnulokinase/L-fuculokinase
MKYTLAVDMGATSVRGILGYIKDGKLVTEEILRFSHDRIKKDNRSRWDLDKKLENISRVITEYGEMIHGIGVDTWGVDFGVLDVEGNLIENPVSYRDDHNILGYEYAKEKMDLKEIFMNTGNQVMSINTLFQILALRLVNSENYNKIDKILMMPDLINYFLTGEKYSEATITSTSQIYNLQENKFSEKLLEKFEIDKKFFSNVIPPGRIIGTTKGSKIKELTNLDIPVITTASHDTASAVLVTEAFVDQNALFLSCGTWSLMGCLTDKPVILEEVYRHSITNETGYGKTNMLFANITGLYLLEKLKAQLEIKYEREISFAEITKYIENSEEMELFFDVSLPQFERDEYDVIFEIDRVIKRSLKNDMDYFHIIYRSLVEKYKETMEKIVTLTGRKFNKIHMIGGGVKSTILCQMIADHTGLEVLAGPIEATAYGNILVQQIALGEVKNLQEGLEIIRNSSEFYKYTPKIKNNLGGN